jgi:hypothetical protein
MHEDDWEYRTVEGTQSLEARHSQAISSEQIAYKKKTRFKTKT